MVQLPPVCIPMTYKGLPVLTAFTTEDASAKGVAVVRPAAELMTAGKVITGLLRTFAANVCIIVDSYDGRIYCSSYAPTITSLKTAVRSGVVITENELAPVSGSTGRSVEWGQTRPQDFAMLWANIVDPVTTAVVPKYTVESLAMRLLEATRNNSFPPCFLEIDQLAGKVRVIMASGGGDEAVLSNNLKTVSPDGDSVGIAFTEGVMDGTHTFE